MAENSCARRLESLQVNVDLTLRYGNPMTPLELTQAFKVLAARVDALEKLEPVIGNEILARLTTLENKFRMFVARSARQSEKVE